MHTAVFDILPSLPPPQPLPYLDKTETITLFLFIFDYLIRVCTVHAVPQRLIYWDGRRINEDHTVGRTSFPLNSPTELQLLLTTPPSLPPSSAASLNPLLQARPSST